MNWLFGTFYVLPTSCHTDRAKNFTANSVNNYELCLLEVNYYLIVTTPDNPICNFLLKIFYIILYFIFLLTLKWILSFGIYFMIVKLQYKCFKTMKNK